MRILANWRKSEKWVFGVLLVLAASISEASNTFRDEHPQKGPPVHPQDVIDSLGARGSTVRGLAPERYAEFVQEIVEIDAQARQIQDWTVEWAEHAGRLHTESIVARMNRMGRSTESARRTARWSATESLIEDINALVKGPGTNFADRLTTLAAARSVRSYQPFPVMPDGGKLYIPMRLQELGIEFSNPTVTRPFETYEDAACRAFVRLVSRMNTFEDEKAALWETIRSSVQANEDISRFVDEFVELHVRVYTLGWSIREANVRLLRQLKVHMASREFSIIFEALDAELFQSMHQGHDVSQDFLAADGLESDLEKREAIQAMYDACVAAKYRSFINSNELYRDIMHPDVFEKWFRTTVFYWATRNNPTDFDRDILAEAQELGKVWAEESIQFKDRK
ncbi:MAG: hypothetical protein ACR2GY_06570 [Phycisphaerales bacterium]